MTEFANAIAFDSPHAICWPKRGRIFVWYGAHVHVGTAPIVSYASICRAAFAAHSGGTAQSFHPHASTPLTFRLVGTATFAPSAARRSAKSSVASPRRIVLSIG